MRKIYKSILFVLLLALPLCLLYLESRSSDPRVVRIGISPWPSYEYLYRAEQKGFFQEAGLEIKIVQFGSLKDARVALENGQIDGMASTLVEVLQAHATTGKRLKIALLTDFSNGADVIMARGSMTSALELRGKRVGVEHMSAGIYLLYRFIEKHGLSIRDVEVQDVDQVIALQLLKEKKLEAVATYAPYSAAIAKSKVASVIYDSAEIPGEVLDVVSVNEVVIRHNPDFHHVLRRAWGKALAYAASQP